MDLLSSASNRLHDLEASNMALFEHLWETLKSAGLSDIFFPLPSGNQTWLAGKFPINEGVNEKKTICNNPH